MHSATLKDRPEFNILGADLPSLSGAALSLPGDLWRFRSSESRQRRALENDRFLAAVDLRKNFLIDHIFLANLP